MISDGAACYPKFAECLGPKHMYVSHAPSEFSRTQGSLRVNMAKIDGISDDLASGQGLELSESLTFLDWNLGSHLELLASHLRLELRES